MSSLDSACLCSLFACADTGVGGSDELRNDVLAAMSRTAYVAPLGGPKKKKSQSRWHSAYRVGTKAAESCVCRPLCADWKTMQTRLKCPGTTAEIVFSSQPGRRTRPLTMSVGI